MFTIIKWIAALVILTFIATFDLGHLTAAAIWEVVKVVAHGMGLRVFKSTVYQLSAEPGEPGVEQRQKQNGVVVELIATFDEWHEFRRRLNEQGVWAANARWVPFGNTLKFVYSFLAVNLRKPE